MPTETTKYYKQAILSMLSHYINLCDIVRTNTDIDTPALIHIYDLINDFESRLDDIVREGSDYKEQLLYGAIADIFEEVQDYEDQLLSEMTRIVIHNKVGEGVLDPSEKKIYILKTEATVYQSYYKQIRKTHPTLFPLVDHDKQKLDAALFKLDLLQFYRRSDFSHNAMYSVSDTLTLLQNLLKLNDDNDVRTKNIQTLLIQLDLNCDLIAKNFQNFLQDFILFYKGLIKPPHLKIQSLIAKAHVIQPYKKKDDKKAVEVFNFSTTNLKDFGLLTASSKKKEGVLPMPTVVAIPEQGEKRMTMADLKIPRPIKRKR